MLYLINTILLVAAVFVSHTASPVDSVIFLILAFCGASLILFMFSAEFIALIFIIIYVGAIAVLFLFVIMMLDIKDHSEELENETEFSVFHWVFLGCIFAASLYMSLYFALYLGVEFLPLKLSSFWICEFSDSFIEKNLLWIQDRNGLELSFSNWYLFHSVEPISYLSLIDDLNNIDLIGQMLYNEQLVNFLLAGLILLIALIGSIVLTFQFNTSTEKHQNVNRQLARTDNFVSFFQ
jgi:NADH-quinone oxidoreductase subunit J